MGDFRPRSFLIIIRTIGSDGGLKVLDVFLYGR